MIFRQRMTVTDLGLYTWTPAQTSLLRAWGFMADLWSARGRGHSTPAVDNWQIVTAAAVGVFIGLSAGMLLTHELLFAIAYIAPLGALAMLQFALQQDSNVRQREPLPAQQAGEQLNQQQEQNPAEIPSEKEGMLRIVDSLPDPKAMTLLVEDALRHLCDNSYLGQHPLAQLEVIQRQKPSEGGSLGFNTHLDLGRTLRCFLIDMIAQLRPTGPLPSGAMIPPREWHPYLILHASYVQGELVREVLARLYVGEGTYNRIRRRAIQSVARAILEIEQQTRNHPVCA